MSIEGEEIIGIYRVNEPNTPTVMTELNQVQNTYENEQEMLQSILLCFHKTYICRDCLMFCAYH